MTAAVVALAVALAAPVSDGAVPRVRMVPWLGHSSNVTSAEFSPDGTRVVTASGDDTARLWDASSGAPLAVLEGHTEWVNTASFSPDGTRVVTASYDGTARLWDAASGAPLAVLQGHTAFIESASFSPDGTRVVAASDDGTARLWDAATGEPLAVLQGHVGWVNSAEFTPDGTQILTASDDGTARVWDAQTGAELCALLSFEDGTWAVLAPDGRYDASNGGDVQGVNWVIDGREPIALAQLKDEYYEPGLLAKLMGFNDEPMRKITPLNELDITLPPGTELSLDGQTATITLTDRGGGIGRTEVSLQGALVHTEPAPPASQIREGRYTFTLDLSRPEFARRLLPQEALAEGQTNQLEVVGHTNDPGANEVNPEYLASRGIVADVVAPASEAAQPRLFILAVGVSDYAGQELDLRYAAKDAVDLADALRLAGTTWLGEENVFTTVLASDPELSTPPATRENIEAAFAEIAENARSTDVLVVFLSGHGVSAGTGETDYFYLTAELETGNTSTQQFRELAVSGQDISDWMRQIPAVKQALILDTCASGEFSGGRQGGTDIRRSWERMKDRAGMFILAGCAADAVAYESTRFNQGLLTYSLIEAMKGEAVWRFDPAASALPFLDVQAWFRAAEDAVPDLARGISGIQKPEFRSGTDARSFDLGQLSPEQRALIPLQTPLPVLLAPANVRDEASPAELDTLGLRAELAELMRANASRGRGTGFSFWQQTHLGAYAFNVRYVQESGQIRATIPILRYEMANGTLVATPVGEPLQILAPPADIAKRVLDAVLGAIGP